MTRDFVIDRRAAGELLSTLLERRLMLLLDTNALLWTLQGNPRLSPAARDMIREGWSVGAVAVSVVTFWEIAVLAEKQKLVLGCDAARWRSDRIDEGLRELPLHGRETVRAVALGRQGFHRDPADRFIVATAIIGGHTLMTTDKEILAWPGDLRRVDVRRSTSTHRPDRAGR